MVPIAINHSEDWLRHIQVERTHWPEKRDHADRFAHAVRLVLQRDYPNRASLYDYSFSERFITDIAAEIKYRVEILAMIAKRLTLTAASARGDGQLRDESVAGKCECRFRVTQRPSSTRIHYTYDSPRKIRFLRFYGEGEHDDGL